MAIKVPYSQLSWDNRGGWFRRALGVPSLLFQKINPTNYVDLQVPIPKTYEM